jgi:hypothetical protein
MRPALAFVLVVVGLVALGNTQSVAQGGGGGGGQVVKFGEGQTLTISGFISTTFYVDRGLFGGFGQGQNSEWSAEPANQPAADKTFMDADIRNTRLGFEFAGQPLLGKFAPKAMVEADFFGAFNGVPPFGDEQPQFRLRFAYVDLSNGRTTLRIGQFFSPLFGETPVSVSHLALPLGYGSAGKVGWRFPGIFLYENLNPGKSVVAQLQLALFKGSGPSGNARDTTNLIGNGEASGLPQLEMRLNFTKAGTRAPWSLYLVGHLDWKDTTGTGVASSNMSAWGFEAGGSIVQNKLSLRGNVFTGKAIGQQFAFITQSQRVGNIRGVGGWGQIGVDVTPRWGAYVFYGIDDPDEARYATENVGAPALRRQKNQSTAGLLRFRVGRYTLGLEYLRAQTRWDTGTTHAEQVALSLLYSL